MFRVLPRWLPLHVALLAACVLLGLALRVWFVGLTDIDPQYAPTDDGDYFRRARRFALTGDYIDDHWFIRSPLHVLLFALLLRVSIMLGSIDGVLLIRLVQVALLVLAILAGYGLARRLFTARAGVAFAFVLAVWFPLVELPADLLSEPLFLACFIFHLWLLVWWRDERRWYLLVASGVAFGLAALARSTVLYSGAFVALWLLLEQRRRAGPPDQVAAHSLRARAAHWLSPALVRALLVFGVSALLVVAPWTIRNYLTYQSFIPIDTIGPVNIWLVTADHERRGSEILLDMPQAERHGFARAETRRLIASDPLLFWGRLWQGWEHNVHEIWKLQFLVDFFDQETFHGRPLREVWLLGIAGDMLWLVFTACGLAALAAPLHPHEGAFRVIALGWIAYTIVSIMLLHPEPRYTLPISLMLALYAAYPLGEPYAFGRRVLEYRHWGKLMLLPVGVFLLLCFSSRDYVELVRHGVQREMHLAAGKRAYLADNADTAAQEFRAALNAHPGFVEARALLALTQTQAGDYATARELVGNSAEQRLLLAAGALARAQGRHQQAASLFEAAETRDNERLQPWALRWLPHPRTVALTLGTGSDLGAIVGFSRDGEVLTLPGGGGLSYRWLEGGGRVVLLLPEPLEPGSVLALHMAAGRPEGAPLRVGFVGAGRTTMHVHGEWRTYHLRVPHELAGQQRLVLTLEGPTFMPAHRWPESDDMRLLSVMVHAVAVR
jgi:4-amino-4-deoxy-L-arabinose transferase-like glycosyltransferase